MQRSEGLIDPPLSALGIVRALDPPDRVRLLVGRQRLETSLVPRIKVQCPLEIGRKPDLRGIELSILSRRAHIDTMHDKFMKSNHAPTRFARSSGGPAGTFSR